MNPDTALAIETADAIEPVHTGALNLADHLEALRGSSQRHRVSPRERIVSEGEEADRIFRIVTGCVRLCRHLEGGRRPIADFLFAGDIFGLSTIPAYALSAEAVSPVSLIAYPRAAFETLALINPRVKSEMMEYMARSLMRAQGQLFVLNCQGARERLASFLLRMHGQGQLAYGDRLDLPMGRQDIADHLGLSVETVSRTFTALRRSGLIEIVNTQLVIIKNLPALRLLAEGL